jgi:murein DD-endopeptidase MepM/ murein hydrolase activator NlpD
MADHSRNTGLPASPREPLAQRVVPAPALVEPGAVVDHVIEPVALAAPAAPLSRRARRAQTAEPFQLLEPAVEERVVESSVSVASDAATTDAEHTVDTLARIVAAEAVAAATTAGAVAERPETLLAEPTPAAEAEAVSAAPSSQDQPAARDEPLPGPATEAPASGIDEFEAAARLFSFTSETTVQKDATDEEPAAASAGQDPAPSPHVARRAKASRGASFKRAATASFSVGVLGIVGLMAVGMTTPVEAVAAASGVDASMSVVAPAKGSTVPAIDEDEIQAYVAPSSAQNVSLERTENYGTTTVAELASEAGIKNFSDLFHNDPNSNIQWPFAVGVPMSYGFGMRPGGMHRGIDFTPGAGAPIQAIADGTVRVASEAGGAFGVHVMIDHMIDGQLVSSHYAHMQYGSITVTPGQRVTVGTVIGRTGNTGRSYGAHTHFEILVNGTTRIDPMPWLRDHTDGTHTVG